MTDSVFATIAAAVLLVPSAMATAAEPVTPDANERETAIEVIEVYAQKRPQPKSEVSLAVSSLDGEALAQRRIADTTQLSGLAPNLLASTVAGEGTTPSFNIRGVGMFDYNTTTISPIAIYSDDVVSGGANFLSSSLFDLEQVDVLRGPQGTLFGRNTTGGAILLMSKQPDAEFGGYASAEIAEHDTRQLTAAVNMPLTEQTSARLAVQHKDYQYSMQNLFPLGQDGGMRHNNVRLIVRTELENWVVSSKLTLEDIEGAPKPIYSAGIMAADGSGTRCPLSQVGSRNCVDSFGLSGPSDDFWQTVADTHDKKHDTEGWTGSVNVSGELAPGYQFKSVTAVKDLQRFHSFDSDGPGNFIEGSFDSDNEFFSQEFSLAIEQDGRYWISGLFYLNESLDQQNDLDLFRDFRAIPALAAVPAQFFYFNQLDNQSFSAYSQLDQPLSDAWTLTAGVRFTREQTDYVARADLDTVPVYIPKLWDLAGEVADSEWSGKLALLQKISSNYNQYYSLSRGFKAGGYNGGYSTSPQQAADSTYAPERLTAWEVGGHWLAPQQQLSFDWAAFYYDYQDQQVFVNQTSGPAPYHVLKNAGESTIYGVEAEMSWRPVAAMKLDLAVGHIPKAELGSDQSNALFVADNRLPFTSEWMASGQLEYDLSAVVNHLLVQLGFVYQSEFFFDQYENPYIRQDGYTLWHGRIAYQPTPELELAVFGKNLLNKEYTELKFDSIAALSAVTQLRGEARQLGVGVTYHF
ncbi:TonB-dependent receptor [Rheinheimera riviphila]|uniref:TonB-dependent receptor n=1 Tax=Rheinheimera riviphila TaxID=1834037 RepID=A0A437QGK3_9GAMM|nr:TonB-dependent receptor [Rheinheimera riviphila]RVU33544.1 TonB-dependent receptor [Rheinheimera riviphila]